MTAAVIIPIFGGHALTRALLDDIHRERQLVDVFLVDNGGDWPDHPGARVLRPGQNLGWLRGTNLGLRAALDEGYDQLVALNNDTRLSPGFFQELLRALGRRGVGVAAPCYDDFWPQQRCGYLGPADRFAPRPIRRRVAFVDGTCFAVRSSVIRRVGLLDEDHFGAVGWGAEMDFCARVRQERLSVLVTGRAYLTHASGATASTLHDDYWKVGDEAMTRALEAKWGEGWRTTVGLDNVYLRTRPTRWMRGLARRVLSPQRP